MSEVQSNYPCLTFEKNCYRILSAQLSGQSRVRKPIVNNDDDDNNIYSGTSNSAVAGLSGALTKRLIYRDL